jgi:hypothetical protein
MIDSGSVLIYAKQFLSKINPKGDLIPVYSGLIKSPFYFNNIVYLPDWKYTENTLLLVLVHELGHHWYSPKNIVEYTREINVLEDVRIEKLQENHFSWFSQVKSCGYHELHSQGYFDNFYDKNNSMYFYNKVNMHFKLGTKFLFTEGEKVFLKRIRRIKTFSGLKQLYLDIKKAGH